MQEKESSCSFTCGNTAQERGLSYVPDCFISNKFFIIFLTLLLMVYCTGNVFISYFNGFVDVDWVDDLSTRSSTIKRICFFQGLYCGFMVQ
jgi:hypothetical protein